MRFSILRRDPGYFFENVHEDLNRFLRDAYREFGEGKAERAWRPAIEVKESKDMYKIKAELPGMEKNDIDIEMHENYIAIKGESKKCEEKEGENVYTSEFRYGKFYRSIPLEHPIIPDESKAEFDKGILRISLKKIQEKEPEVKKLTIE
ncbi:heat-shock protein Hsp20 [Candidatus Gastranaerophilus sp. (ex Termes propinquus)]|nr:heat-shock protein Hsp20 [Candidatus Gastranaerophilus sp. (ex Termes propinquus)]